MPLPTYQDSVDDDPRLDTSGRKEEPIADAEDPTPAKPKAATPEAPEVKESPAPEAVPAPEMAPAPEQIVSVSYGDRFENVPPPEAYAEPAAEAVTSAEEPDEEPAEATGPEIVDSTNPLIPQRTKGYYNLPAGAPIVQTAEERHAARINSGNGANTVDRIEDEEAFIREAEEHLALHQGKKKEPDIPEWMKKPAIWPTFIEFPIRKDLEAIRVAEEKGKLDDKLKAEFNEHFQKHSEHMQARARQLDVWLLEENAKIFANERNIMGGFRARWMESRQSRSTNNLVDAREKAEKQRQADLEAGVTPTKKDPFYDIKWAILLDPYASPDDPRFKNVARWGHSTATTHDGGELCVDDDGMFTPKGNEGSEMSGALAVQEAYERGWTSIDIAGSEEFVKGAREAAIKMGMGAKITTRYGLLGRSKPEFIMPNPPKLSGIETDADELQDAHSDLTRGEGKAPKEETNEASKTSPKDQPEKAPAKDVEPAKVKVEGPWGDRQPDDEQKRPEQENEDASAPAPV
jgi:hypothetical protein